MHPTASLTVVVGIGLVELAAVMMFVVAVGRVTRRWGATVVLTVLWVGLTGAAAVSGLLGRFDLRPPPLAALMLATVALGVGLGVSPLGKRLTSLPWFALVGAQAFRLPLELFMHRAALEGTMPSALSYSGFNFDIVLGASSLVVAWLVRQRERRLLLAGWNVLGTVTLAVIAVIAVLTAPMVKALGETQVNTWVTFVPFVWVPAVCVVVALASHVVAWRKLLKAAAGATAGTPNGVGETG